MTNLINAQFIFLLLNYTFYINYIIFYSATEENILKVLASWKQFGVSALARGFLPAIHGENEIKPLLAPLVGANVDEIAVMNHLSVNLHLLMNSFYAPTGKK